eukprot:scaffold121297_cov19-Tisochrysis_lutea.AAC.1
MSPALHKKWFRPAARKVLALCKDMLHSTQLRLTIVLRTIALSVLNQLHDLCSGVSLQERTQTLSEPMALRPCRNGLLEVPAFTLKMPMVSINGAPRPWSESGMRGVTVAGVCMHACVHALGKPIDWERAAAADQRARAAEQEVQQAHASASELEHKVEELAQELSAVRAQLQQAQEVAAQELGQSRHKVLELETELSGVQAQFQQRQE